MFFTKIYEELNLEDRIEIINDFLEDEIKYFEDYAKKLGDRQHPKGGLLDKLFIDTLRE